MKSPVRAFFGFTAGADGKQVNKEKPACNACCRTVAQQMKGNSRSNLMSHLTLVNIHLPIAAI